MKKLLLILLCFFSLNTLTYASFPITESPTEQLSESNTEALLSAKSSASWLGALHWAWMAFIITISVLLLLTLIGLIIVATLTGGMGGQWNFNFRSRWDNYWNRQPKHKGANFYVAKYLDKETEYDYIWKN